MLQTGKKTLRRSTAAAAWLVTMIGCSLLVESTLDGKGGDDACGGACGIGTLCVDGACELSVCGDGVIDPQTEEQCEDGNDVSGDGCEPTTCRFSCQEDANCANEEDPCSGSG
ncbi:MAG: hypothetical protein KC416_03945, partial [Myxococcales bacterium]|nr:hypothetical protein [Myxococcales bacterium]